MDGFVQEHFGRFCGPPPTPDSTSRSLGPERRSGLRSVILALAPTKNDRPWAQRAIEGYSRELPPHRTQRMVALGRRHHHPSPDGSKWGECLASRTACTHRKDLDLIMADNVLGAAYRTLRGSHLNCACLSTSGHCRIGAGPTARSANSRVDPPSSNRHCRARQEQRSG